MLNKEVSYTIEMTKQHSEDNAIIPDFRNSSPQELSFVRDGILTSGYM